jgi:glutamate 5-kinase
VVKISVQEVRNARFIREVTDLNDDILAMASKTKTDVGRGGMETKLKAAQIAMAAGCNMFITSGTIAHPLKSMQEGANFTCFIARDTPRSARKKWIAAGLSSSGRLTIDAGAEKALKSGKSLLPAGVTQVEGEFQRGDLVTVVNTADIELGRGLVAYSSDDAARIIGHKSGEITEILGYSGRDEMIHRDELALN